VVTDDHCDYLDEAGRCTIYAERHRNRECLTIEQMINMGTVPKFCLHVKDNRAYQERTDTRLYAFEIVDDQARNMYQAEIDLLKQALAAERKAAQEGKEHEH